MSKLPSRKDKKYFNGFWYKRDFLAKIAAELSGCKPGDSDEMLDVIIEGIVKGDPTRYALFASRLDEERARW